MSPTLVIAVVLGYFGLLFVVSLITSRDSSSSVFFTANHRSPWYLVAYGMVGVALSGITFISVPGSVGAASGQLGFHAGALAQKRRNYVTGRCFLVTLHEPTRAPT